MKSLPLLLLVLITALLASCSKDKVIYQDFVEIPETGWTYDSPASFNFEIADTSSVYRLLFFIDFSTGYAWENLYTRIHTKYPTGDTLQNVLSLELASSTGEWFGNCNSNNCKLNIPLQDKVRFEDPGTYRIDFEQYMREQNLQGVNSIGLKVVKMGEM